VGEVDILHEKQHTTNIIKSWYGHIAGREADKYISGCTLEEASWRTIFTDSYASELSAQAKRVRIVNGIPNVSALPPRNEGERNKLSTLSPSLNAAYLIWKTLIVTKKGYIGIAGAATRIGDTVAVLLGGMTPFVLRKYGQVYRLIGER